jgi:hypothetical protein
VKARSAGRLLIGAAVLLALVYGTWKFESAWRFLAGFVTRSAPVTEVMTSGEVIVMRTPGGALEIARIKAYENLRRTAPGDKVLWGLFDTGTTVSEIDVAALYRYHIDMAREWPLRCDRRTCVVQAGAIQPTLPPAVYTEEMRKRTESGWARFDKDANLALLERSMSAELSQRATTARNMQAATDAGRRTVQEFVRTWLLNARIKPGEPMPRVVVLFPGESPDSQPRVD